jgi:hypothetical protein
VKSVVGAETLSKLLDRLWGPPPRRVPESIVFAIVPEPPAGHELGTSVRLRCVYCPTCSQHRTEVTRADADWPASVPHIPCRACKAAA